jgi:CheY-like chemotaxis protein
MGLDQSSQLEECLQHFQPHLILLDIWMSGGDGRDLAKWIRQQDATKSIPIVIVSANLATQQIAKEVKADDFILKPFDVDHLISVVEKRLKKTRSDGKT